MIKTRQNILCILILFMILPLQAGERTIPVDIFLMIDKSQSMAEPGKFESLTGWVRTQLIDQILIDEDWITVYQFYGKADHLSSMTIKSAFDRQNIIKTIDSIRPDGQYTDIGLALDTIREALDSRGPNDRHKVMILLTDLKQEAPWTSRYAGSPETFESPYLAEARIIPHDAWFEITLDMDIQDMVVKTSKELFSSITETSGQPVDLSVQKGTNDTNNTILASDSGLTLVTSSPMNTAEKTSQKDGIQIGTLPLSLILVLLSIIISACAFVILFIRMRNKKEREHANEKTDTVTGL